MSQHNARSARWSVPPSGNTERPHVSVFTAACDLGEQIGTAARSLLRQTYEDWEWVVVDDSHHDETAEYLRNLADAPGTRGRVRLVDKDSPPGSIGAAKALAAQRCRGDILVELDHDDELVPEALELIASVFAGWPDIDFVYSDWIDWVDQASGSGFAARYTQGWAFGFGAYASEVVGGRRVSVALAPPITWETVRHIVGMPNHVRAWRASFYRHMGGHRPDLPVADDFELLVRTFLSGSMARIPRALYIQHHSPDGKNASRTQNAEIQRRVATEAARWKDALDARCLLLALQPSGQDSPFTTSAPIEAGSVVIDPIAAAAADLGTPLVSVVIPTYQRPELLRRAVASVLRQSYSNLEVLIVGDHCPFVDAEVESFDDPRIRHWNLGSHHADYGTAARNYALKAMARGTFIAYLDDDNVWKPDHLDSLVALFQADPTVTFAFSSFEAGTTPIICLRPRLFQIDTSALLHRRFLLERFGYWRATADVGYAHDWELVSRWEGEPWAASRQPTLIYTLGDSERDRRVVETLKHVADEEFRAVRTAD